LSDARTTGSVGPNLDSAHPDAELVHDRVTNGKGGMPAFQGQLEPEEIDAVADYVANASKG
jgi:sulfite dehydrogenase